MGISEGYFTQLLDISELCRDHSYSKVAIGKTYFEGNTEGHIYDLIAFLNVTLIKRPIIIYQKWL